jgi:signal transduction histidine kinase/ActR/RegA family two-component response regulator
VNKVSTFELLQQAPGFFAYSRGPDHVYELANAAYFNLIGHRDIIGKPANVALPEIAAQGFIALLDQVTATGEPFRGRGLPVTLLRNGVMDELYVDFIMQPIRDESGVVVGILHQGHELTDYVREKKLRDEAEAKYRNVLGAIDQSFCIIHVLKNTAGEYSDYRFVEANQAFEDQTGLVHPVGKTIREMVPNLEGDWARIYGGVAATGEAIRVENFEPAMNRWFDVHAHRVGEPGQDLVALVFQNTTVQKEAEAAVAKALADEQIARQQAEDANRTRDNFLAVVSHELRTPLSAMLGWVQLLRSETLPAEKQAKALETIERNARAQAQLIEDLLDVSRIISGKLHLESARVVLRPIVEAALDSVRPAALAKGIVLDSELASGTRVLGDAARLQQIVINLLTNAVKFTPPHGRVMVKLRLEGNLVELSVADTGKGITPAFLPRVFDRFRQEEHATTRRAKGLGLGLSIVHELVEMHGGTVTAASDGEHLGATFTVRIPVAAAREATPARAAKALDPSALKAAELRGLRILLLEDEPDTRELVETLFTRVGATVTPTGTGDEAIAALKATTPDLFISDIGLPGEDGYSVIARVRELPNGRTVPAIALTAYAREEDRQRALESGFDAHMTKPVEPALLLELAVSSVRQRRAR